MFSLVHRFSSPARSLRTSFTSTRLALGLAMAFLVGTEVARAAAPEISLAGDWSVRVRQRHWLHTSESVLSVPPPQPVSVVAERYERLPEFNPQTAGWVKGAQLRGLQAQETTTPFLLDPESVVVRAGSEANAMSYRAGTDYQFDPVWGTLGRQAGGAIGADQPVYLAYRYFPLRLDSVIRRRGGRLEIRAGEPRSAAPNAPDLHRGERRLANLWLPGRVAKLEAKHLFPILAAAYEPASGQDRRIAEKLLPRTLAKLRAGESLRVLAWGDSVTDGSYLPNPAQDRWQEQFVARLRRRFPAASIELVTEAWGGRNTHSFLNEPPGSPHNYREKVLGARADLIVSEFVNDAGLNPAQVEERYGALLKDFQAGGAEWIILTPHYVRPDWMGLDRENHIDADPRPYVTGLREFGARHGVAIAEGSLRYGHLWREGIPYTSLMLNSINHPNARGMALFADALMDVFP